MRRTVYAAVQLGFGVAKKMNSPEKGHLKGLGQFRYIREFRLDNAEGIKVGDKVDVESFKAGDLVDVIGISNGKGFAGVVKSYHFKGGQKTHGQSDRTRHPGAIGSTTSPGRVWKGHADGRTYGQRPGDGEKPGGLSDQCRPESLAGQGCRPRCQKWSGDY